LHCNAKANAAAREDDKPILALIVPIDGNCNTTGEIRVTAVVFD
jgi:hypothetical protein